MARNIDESERDAPREREARLRPDLDSLIALASVRQDIFSGPALLLVSDDEDLIDESSVVGS